MARPFQATVYLAGYNHANWIRLKSKYPYAADSQILNAALRDWLPKAVKYGLDANCDILVEA